MRVLVIEDDRQIGMKRHILLSWKFNETSTRSR